MSAVLRELLERLAALEAPDAPRQDHDALIDGDALAALGAVGGLDAKDPNGRRELTDQLIELRDRGWVVWDGEPSDGFCNLRITVGGYAEHARHSSVRTSAARQLQDRRSGDQIHDVFLSHASEDTDFVRELYAALIRRGYSVWFDKAELTVGDSLRRRIDEGLATARFGVVVVSPAFLSKEWPKRELDGLTAKEIAGETKVILPVWHGISAAEVAVAAPMLAGLLAVSSAEGAERVADRIARAIDRDRGAERAVSEAPPVEADRREANRRVARQALRLAIALVAGFDVGLLAYLIVRS
jgi:hypothetical protein